MSEVRSIDVRTDGDNFASVWCAGTLVEFSKDGDSPACPDSWTWGLWRDGEFLDASSDETSLASAVSDAVDSISDIAAELTAHGIGPRQAVAAAEACTDDGMPIWQYVSKTAQGIVDDCYFLLEGCDGAELEAYDQVRELAGKMRYIAEDMRQKGYR